VLLVDDERVLVARARAGDDGAFVRLAEHYAAFLYRLAYRMLGNAEDAEDVRQETLLRAYAHLRTFRGEASFATWLAAIAVKCCLSHRRARRPELPMPEERPATGAHGDPERAMLAQEEQARVQRVLATLAPPDRLLIILKYIEGFSHEEIAQVLHCSVESSRSRLARARKLFCERFHREASDGTG